MSARTQPVVKTTSQRMSIDDAVLYLRRNPRFQALVRDAYLGSDVSESAKRFTRSAEFQEVRRLVGELARGVILDVGAGTGIASYAFAVGGARAVYALEPNSSSLVGRGAIAVLSSDLPVRVLDAHAESIPLKDESVDVVYARQVLHHTLDLRSALNECARVLRPGGRLLACREHVVAGEDDLRAFLASHPIEALVGGENAFPLHAYTEAIEASGLVLEGVFGPCDSLINAYPEVTTSVGLAQLPFMRLYARFGSMSRLVIAVPGVRALINHRLNRPSDGRLYTFLATKEAHSS
jgi:SAM-dependent methyltransferase